nr:hypothetical protein [Paraburkholderia ribeironis]
MAVFQLQQRCGRDIEVRGVKRDLRNLSCDADPNAMANLHGDAAPSRDSTHRRSGCSVVTIDDEDMNPIKTMDQGGGIAWSVGDPAFDQEATARTKTPKSKGATVAQLVLAWLLAQSTDLAPIPGTRSEERFVESPRAIDRISRAEIERSPIQLCCVASQSRQRCRLPDHFLRPGAIA